jgi:hypothetical protein
MINEMIANDWNDMERIDSGLIEGRETSGRITELPAEILITNSAEQSRSSAGNIFQVGKKFPVFMEPER